MQAPADCFTETPVDTSFVWDQSFSSLFNHVIDDMLDCIAHDCA